MPLRFKHDLVHSDRFKQLLTINPYLTIISTAQYTGRT